MLDIDDTQDFKEPSSLQTESTSTPYEVNKTTQEQCQICGKLFKNKITFYKHLRKVHGVNAKGETVINPEKSKLSCIFCGKCYVNSFSLQRHIDSVHLYDKKNINKFTCTKCSYTTFHKHNLQKHFKTVKHTDVKSKEGKPFKCPQCDAQYAHKRNLIRHKTKVHGSTLKSKSICRKCPICPFHSNNLSKKDIHKHFEEKHGFSMKWECHEFKSFEEFQLWREGMETATKTSYVQQTSSMKNLIYYKCNRCGTYRPQGTGRRRSKVIGSTKINSFCPAEIKVQKGLDLVKVKYLATHVGHKNSIEYTRLSLQDKKFIALKIHNKVPPKEILTSIRNSLLDKKLQRLHLINYHDIMNIKASLDIQEDKIKHPSNVVGSEARVTELNKSMNTSVLTPFTIQHDSGTNTNVSLGNFDNVLKYLEGETDQRMDKSVNGVVNFNTDKVFDVIIEKTRGKMYSELKNLRKSHKSSLTFNLDNITQITENTWKVLSSTQTEFYTVQKIKSCFDCRLKCTHCQKCFHEFSCSCVDSTVKNNMCKHIHAVCRKLLSDANDDTDFNNEQEIEEEQTIVEELLMPNEPLDNKFEAEKKLMVEEFKQMLTELETKIFFKEQLDFLSKEKIKIKTVIESMNLTENFEMEHAENT